MTDRHQYRPLCTRGLVVGIGNPDRGDDGAGGTVVRRLANRLPPGIDVMERSGDILALIETWAKFDTVILVDAAASITAPGHIHRIEPIVEPLAQELAPSSTHAFGLADAIELARNLDMLPRKLIVFAIEAATFDVGAGLSPPVAAAVEEVAGRIAAEFDEVSVDARTTGGHAHA